MFADIHAHILCDIDDGPKTFEQSVELLKSAFENGIDRIVATPHFYASYHSLDERIAKRDERFNLLNEYIRQSGLTVKILPGFEVRYFDGISRSDSLDKLCINNSKVLLLELGLIPITEKVIDEIVELDYSGYTVVLAHIERYHKMPGFKAVQQILKNKYAIAQLTASSLLSGPFKSAAFRLLKQSPNVVIASDMHSVDVRPPVISEAYDAIKAKFGTAKQNTIIYNSNRLFDIVGE